MFWENQLNPKFIKDEWCNGSEVAEVGNQNTAGCKMRRFGEKSSFFRSGVVFTPEVGMKHVDRRWKAYPVGNKGKSPESEHGAAKC